MTTPSLFVRGYRNFSIDRVLMITDEDDRPPRYRPLHESQRHLRDDELEMLPCIFCDDFALVAVGQPVSRELQTQCPDSGVVRDILYQITADNFGTPVHVGDLYFSSEAREVARSLTFDTGCFSRCWEISSRHLPRKAFRYLQVLASEGSPPEVLFEAFHSGRAVGCKLCCTPWRADLPPELEGTNSLELRHQQLLAGVPDSLVHVLHLAGVADTRILIFDPDAKVLPGLRIDRDWISPYRASAAKVVHGTPHEEAVRPLLCSLCGALTIGRQWLNREAGYGICATCVEWLRQRSTPPVEMLQTYGHEGVHFHCTPGV
jgi:hypothetical protein